MSYKLSASLVGHEDDIKSLAKVRDGEVVSVSRDCTLRKWTRDENNVNTWHQNILYKDSKYLNSVAAGSSKVVFGGQSSQLLEITAAGAAPETVGNHSSNICALSIDHGLVVTGSWDSTAKVWDVSGQLLYSLKGHETSVWAVLIMSQSVIITASADRSIIVWQNGKQVKVVKSAHDDAIRGLCKVDSNTFASCSNDSSVKIWDVSDDLSTVTPKHTFIGHTSFVYTIASHANSTLISGGEDRSVRVWDLSTYECLQVITLPCTSIWTVLSLNDTDFVCGGSDNVIRVFSNASNRFASNEEIQHLEQAVASTGLGQDQTGGKIDESQISPGEVLTKPGKKEGQVVMIRSGSGGPGSPIEAYQWTTGIWIKIGEVIQSASSGAGKKVLYEGAEYDYVFDVDIREGQPALKLPYNITQNPYEVAHKFVERYELAANYVDDVAKFLISNTETVDLTSQPVQDPYASNRYIPGGGSTTAAGVAPPSTTSNSSFPPRDLSIIPYTQTVSLVSFSPDPIVKALRINNEKNPSSAQLSSQDLSIIESNLKSGITSSSAEELFRYFIKIEQSWTASDTILPALDVLRIIIPSINKPSASIVQTIFSNMDPSSIKTTLLSTRILVNLFSTPAGLKLALNPQIRSNSLELLAPIVQSNQSTKPLNLAIASLLLNYTSTSTDPTSGFELLTAIASFKSTPTASLDSETAYRLLLALGTVLTNPIISSLTLKDAALNLDLLAWSISLSDQFPEQRVKDLLNEITRVLS